MISTLRRFDLRAENHAHTRATRNARKQCADRRADKFSRFTAKLASMKEVNYALEQRHANLLEIQAREYDHATRGRSKR